MGLEKPTEWRRPRLYLIVGAIVVACGVVANSRFCRRYWTKPSEAPVQVDFDARVTENLLVVNYTVRNRTGAPILVFDQMPDDEHWDREHKASIPDPAWAYVDFAPNRWSLRGRRHKVVLSRRQSEQGDFPCYSAQVPYAHPLGAGLTLSGEFRLPLPLHRMTAGDVDLRDQGAASLESSKIEDIELRIGWTAEIPTLTAEEMKTVETPLPTGETLWNISYAGYSWVQKAQQIASSTTRPARREGDDFK